MTTPVAAAAEVIGLTKSYGRTTAVDDLSFTVGRGRVTGFLGPNGAGKTTTLRVLLGLATPTPETRSCSAVGSPSSSDPQRRWAR